MTIFANCHIFKKNPEIVIQDKIKKNYALWGDELPHVAPPEENSVLFFPSK